MKRIGLSCIAVILVFISANLAHASSPVWKIVKGDNHLFIGGTIHVLAKSDYPLPSTFEKAYRQSAILVFETDMQKMQNPEFQQALLGKVTYPDGNNMKSVLKEATYSDLKQHLSRRGVPIDNLVNFKPGMVMITLTFIELQRLGLSGTGVDEFYNLRAINDRKKLGRLETVDEQLTFISEMGIGQEDELIAYCLNDLKKLPEQMQALKDAWRNGNDKKLKEIAISPLVNKFPKIYYELIANRNKSWIPKIEAMLKTKEVEFILVGAMHLVGSDGVLAQLTALGYDVQVP